MLAQTVKAMNDQELSELSRDVAREIAQRGGRVSDGALSIAVAALQQIAQLGSQERDRVTARSALDCIDALGGQSGGPPPGYFIPEGDERCGFTMDACQSHEAEGPRRAARLRPRRLAF